MTDDPRVTCATCRNLRGGRCTDAKRAGFVLQRIEIAPALAELPQHCPAHVARARAPALPPEFSAPNSAGEVVA